MSQVEGEATRTPSGGTAEALQTGSAIEVGDELEVKPGGNLALLLTDESTLVLAEGSRLKVDEATFSGLDRKSFSARLLVGTVWAKVKKAVGGAPAKFDITTERAVAGVRGTTFQVEVEGEEMRVDVEEGLVEVAQGEGASDSAQPAASRVHQVRGGERLRVLRAKVLRERFASPRGKFGQFIRTTRERMERLHRTLPERREHRREQLRERRRGQ